ncbi:MAG: aspartate dehydrogenase [Lachnospiraceae bacterium]|nr:aspartate dehydrogenase [Lachnospiraceae bacterium]
MSMFGKKKTEKKTYDRENQRPVLKCSICNGEQVAGFEDIRTGRFEEVMFIQSDKDLHTFMEMYGVDNVTKKY